MLTMLQETQFMLTLIILVSETFLEVLLLYCLSLHRKEKELRTFNTNPCS